MLQPNTDAGQAHSVAGRAHRAMRSQDQTPAMQAVAEWINALCAYEQASQLTCNPDELYERQIRLRQLVALRDAVMKPVATAPVGIL